MTKSEIATIIEQQHAELLQTVAALSDTDFLNASHQKWTAGQQLEHIAITLGLINDGLRYPSWLIQWKFGKSNRPSRSYDEIVERYQERLKGIVVVNPKYAPKVIGLDERSAVTQRSNKPLRLSCVG